MYRSEQRVNQWPTIMRPDNCDRAIDVRAEDKSDDIANTT